MKVVILAGGKGTRLSEETRTIPKPMVRIGDRPIIWHIMQRYATYGFTDFVIPLGYKGYVIKEYFSNYRAHQSDFTVDLSNGELTFHSDHSENWKVTLVDTGLETMTGGRIKKLLPYLSDTFMLTYGDGVADINIEELVKQHLANNTQATMTAVVPTPRFGALKIVEDRVETFSEKSKLLEARINGGFFVLDKKIVDLVDGEDCIFEKTVLPSLAQRSQLSAYEHNGFWMPMDTLREKEELEEIFYSGNAPWLKY